MATSSHGVNAYSTFSESRINLSRPDHQQKNGLNKYLCFLCTFSTSLILHPVGPFRCVWDMIVMVLLIYTAIELPFTMAFGQSNYIFYIGLVVDAVLFTDILLNFHTAYFDKYDNLKMITSKKYICKKYFRTWFFIDFVTCIPYELFYRLDSHSETSANGLAYIKILRIFRLLRIVKILRLVKMVKIFDVFKKQFIVREVLMALRICKMVFGMLIFAHFAACLWWFVGCSASPSWIDEEGLRTNDVDTFTKYSTSWYWAVVTLFTTGYGDIVATNTLEQWVSSICILIGTCFFAYFIGTLTVLITEGDKVRSFEIDKLEEAALFCEKKRLPKELTHAICSHIRYHTKYNYVFDEAELLSVLPSYLRHDINNCVAKQFLLNIGIFQNEYINLPEYIIGCIAIKCKAISCNQCFRLYEIGDIAKEFYIQRTGKAVMYDKNGKILKQLSRGDVCGEYSSILFKKRKVKVECETWSEFYSLNVDDIKEVLDEYYPKSCANKWKRIKQYIKTSYDKKTKHNVQFQDPRKYTNALNHTSLKHATSMVQIGNENKVVNKLYFNSKPDTSATQTSNSKSESQKMSVNAFNKLKIRQNSNVRNLVVIAHGEKHNRLKTPLPTPQSSQHPTLNAGSTANGNVLELTDFVSAENCDVKIEKDLSETDSECSLSSISNRSFGVENGIDKALNSKQKVKHNKQKNIKKARRKKAKRKIGKFGGRKGGGFSGIRRGKNKSGLCRSQTYSKVAEDESESESDSEEILDGQMDEKNKNLKLKRRNRIRKSSLDSTILLTTYNNNSDIDGNNEQTVKSDGEFIGSKKSVPFLMIHTNSINKNVMTKNQTVK